MGARDRVLIKQVPFSPLKAVRSSFHTSVQVFRHTAQIKLTTCA